MKKIVQVYKLPKATQNRLARLCVETTGKADFLEETPGGRIVPVAYTRNTPDELAEAKRLVAAAPDARRHKPSKPPGVWECEKALYIELGKLLVLSVLTLAVITLIIHFIFYA